VRRSLALAIIAVLNLLVLFAYPSYAIAILGPRGETDAFFASLAIPQMLTSTLSGPISYCLVPVLAGSHPDDIKRDGWDFLQLTAIILAVVVLLLCVTAAVWTPWLMPGFSGETLELYIKLTRIQLCTVILVGMGAVLGGVENARNRFIWVDFTGLLGSIAGFLFELEYLPAYGVSAVAWGLFLRAACQVLILFPVLGHYRTPSFRNPTINEVFSRMRPIIAGSIYYKTDLVVDRYLASLAPIGLLSILSYAQQVCAAGNHILNKTFAAPLLPALTCAAGQNDWRRFSALYRKQLVVSGALSITGLVMIALLGKTPLLTVLAHGRVNTADVETFWLMLLALGGVLVGGVQGQVITSGFYAYGDTRVPTRIGIIGFTVGVVAKIAGFGLWGIFGIAIGASFYYALNVTWLLSTLEKTLQSRRSGSVSQ
jgi:putative peptidoglycan lipid II flippase